jgi:hypothetical protein
MTDLIPEEKKIKRNRLRDMGLGFLLCAALVISYNCGESGSQIGPGAANASIMASNRQVVGATIGDGLGYVVVDTETGKIVYSERVDSWALGTEGDKEISRKERYW